MARAFCLLILPLFLFGGEEFIFWAKYSSSNNILKSQIVAISNAMVLSQKDKVFLCDLNSTKFKNETTLNYLKRNEDELFGCFSSSQILLNETSKFSLKSADANTHITVVPLRFIVDFKPSGARISKIKSR